MSEHFQEEMSKSRKQIIIVVEKWHEETAPSLLAVRKPGIFVTLSRLSEEAYFLKEGILMFCQVTTILRKWPYFSFSHEKVTVFIV